MVHTKAGQKISKVILDKIKCVNNDAILEEIFWQILKRFSRANVYFCKIVNKLTNLQ